jgi:hypothetical protein
MMDQFATRTGSYQVGLRLVAVADVAAMLIDLYGRREFGWDGNLLLGGVRYVGEALVYGLVKRGCCWAITRMAAFGRLVGIAVVR